MNAADEGKHEGSNVRREIEQTRFTSLTDEWGTPLDKFRDWDAEFNFTLDPCGNKTRPLKGNIETWEKADDGLKRDWMGHRVFVNPPYSEMKAWVAKCYAERNNAELIVLLIFARTDTKYFHEWIYHIAELRFLKGRLKFFPIGSPEGFQQRAATFPSMLCIYKWSTQLSKVTQSSDRTPANNNNNENNKGGK